MKNKKIVESMDKIEPGVLAKNKMLEHILKDSSLIREEPVKHSNKQLPWKTHFPVAVLFALVLLFTLPDLIFNRGSNLLLSNGNIKISFVDKAPTSELSASTPVFTEDEVFSMFDTDIFTGTVKEVKNIMIDIDENTTYQAVAKVTIEKMVDGESTVGETVSILLPGPIENGKIIGGDFNIQPSMKAGDKGIFMPIKHNADYYWSDGSNTVLFSQIAKYGLIDTQHFMFLQTTDGLIFAKDTFPAIRSATTLEEIEVYIESKIK
jgi:hypothetical protein